MLDGTVLGTKRTFLGQPFLRSWYSIYSRASPPQVGLAAAISLIPAGNSVIVDLPVESGPPVNPHPPDITMSSDEPISSDDTLMSDDELASAISGIPEMSPSVSSSQAVPEGGTVDVG